MPALHFSPTKKPSQVVVMGGGTGTSVVLNALKNTPQINLTAVVVVSDNGGSTKRLRDEFGFLPVGDLRQCLAALAGKEQSAAVRKLLLYRFDKGAGLKGHSLGNLILTALEDLEQTPGKAIETAAKIFRITGSVLPVTENLTHLKITYADGQELLGEQNLDNSKYGGKKIAKISLVPATKLYHPAKLALLAADQIILGPGDLYGSLIPNLVVGGIKTVFSQTKAKFTYIVNLMTHYSQTHNMTASDHVAEVIKYSGRIPDRIIINSEPIPARIKKSYQAQHEFPVIDDLATWQKKYPDVEVIRAELASKITTPKVAGDELARSLLRHDGKKLAEVILKKF
jgi:uncharacterized cofD-like protein